MPKSSTKPFDRQSLVDTKLLGTVNKLLYVVLAYFLVVTVLNVGVIFGIKQLLHILVTVFVVKEIDILFLSLSRNVNREAAKALGKENQSLFTALTLSVFMTYSVPIVIVAIVAALATLIAKLLFGGYAYRVFSPSLIGALLLSLGFGNAVGLETLAQTFDNQLFVALSNTTFFSQTLNLTLPFELIDTFVLLLNGGAYVLLPILFLLLVLAKNVARVPLTFLASFVLFYFVFQGSTGLFETMLQFSFLFVLAFIFTDGALMPTSRNGQMIYGILAGLMVNVFILSSQVEPMIFGTLFVSMLTPFLNECKYISGEEKASLPLKQALTYLVTFVLLLGVVQLSWSYYGPLVGKPKVDVLQYFEDTYDPTLFTQNIEPTREYNTDTYGTIQGVYEILDNTDDTVEVLVYNIVTDGFWGPINIMILVDPYTDTILDYEVIRHEEVQGAAYFDQSVIDSMMNIPVTEFNISENVNAGATGTFNALTSMVNDVIAHYTNEEVSLNE